jgi:hypothetical protein
MAQLVAVLVVQQMQLAVLLQFHIQEHLLLVQAELLHMLVQAEPLERLALLVFQVVVAVVYQA